MGGVVEPAQRLWNTWGFHVLVLLSLTLQVMLLVLASIRRRKKSSVLSYVVWSAYVLADTTAVHALGHFFVTSRSPEHELMALWAPLLLVHLGGQDNITAYSVEDNRLWLRHLQSLGVQVVAAAYVLYQSSILNRPTWLRAATILMFVVGVLKYGERIWALKRASSVQSSEVVWLDGFVRTEDKDLDWNADKMYHAIQMHLSQMYNAFYSKAVVMCTWQGICIHVTSLLATVAAFLLFHLFSHKDVCNSVDATATYILLAGAVVLEITSVLRLIFSTTTLHGLMRWRWRWCKLLHRLLESLRQLIHSLMRKAGIQTMYWSGSMGKLDLFYLCTRTRDGQRSKIVRLMGRWGWWIRLDFSWSIAVPTDIIKMLMEAAGERIDQDVETQSLREIEAETERLYHELNSVEERNWKRAEIGKKLRIAMRLVDQSGLRFLGIRSMGFLDEIESLLHGQKLEESILVWHIATHVLLKWYEKQVRGMNPEVDRLAKATEALSNYMVFLLAVHPLQPTGSPRRSCSLNDVVNHGKHIAADERVMSLLREHGFEVDTASLVEIDSTGVTEVIRGTFKTGFQLGVKLISKGMYCGLYKSMALLWVHMLNMVEDKLGEGFHVKQLSNGGEFLTVLSILVNYKHVLDC